MAVIDGFLVSVFFQKLNGTLLPYSIIALLALLYNVNDLIIPYIRHMFSLFSCYLIITITNITFAISLFLYISNIIDGLMLIGLYTIANFIDSIFVLIIKSIIGNCVEKRIEPFVLDNGITNQTMSEHFNRAISFVSIIMSLLVIVVYIGVDNIIKLDFSNLLIMDINQHENFYLLYASILTNIVCTIYILYIVFTEIETLHIKCCR